MPAVDNQHSPAELPLVGLPDLMRMAIKGIDLTPLGTKLIEYVQQHPHAANAWLDIATIFQLKHNPAFALSMQQEALKLRRVYHQAAQQQPVRLRMLAIYGPGDLMANTPIEFLVENSVIALDMLYVTPDTPLPTDLPEHDVIFVAIAESEQNRFLLARVADWLRESSHPVLNRAEYISRLARDDVSERYQDIPGVVFPRTARVARAALQSLAAGTTSVAALLGAGDFPLIIRPVDSHAGQGLERLQTRVELAAYLAQHAEPECFIAPFVDYSRADQRYRKYRIVLMRGKPYLCHMAVSQHWMVHYLNADMLNNADHRAEEAAAMAGFDTGFALRHGDAMREIARRSGLDYLGVDCAETADGQLLVFEIDSNMVVHALDPVDIFPYKQPQMQKVFAAFQQMLIDVAQAA